jgi:hypothetical protein
MYRSAEPSSQRLKLRGMTAMGHKRLSSGRALRVCLSPKSGPIVLVANSQTVRWLQGHKPRRATP